jgi:tRNA(fMet)-specific endonuclease VapC
MMEVRFLIDTNTVIYIRKAQPSSVLGAFRKLRRGEAAISIVTYGELQYGVAKAANPATARDLLTRIVEMLPVLGLPKEAGEFYGTIRADLEKRGRSIGNNDLWIAAHAMANGLTLVTNNEKEFRRVPGLKIENWAR